ncbi:MAG: phage protein Gp27 family protein, partial [Candidatus Binataceae bacterium]
MSESSIVTRLPIAVREELDRRLAARDFKDLQEGLEWLGRQGYRFARGAFIRYRKGFYRRAEAETIAVAQVRAIAEEGGGDVIMAERLARLVRHRLFGALLELSEPIPARDLMGIAKAVAEDSR